MLIKLAALGAIGYVAYKYIAARSDASGNAGASEVRLAGGPLSDQASVQHTADAPPV